MRASALSLYLQNNMSARDTNAKRHKSEENNVKERVEGDVKERGEGDGCVTSEVAQRCLILCLTSEVDF